MTERVKLEKNQKIIFLGCGSVAKCCIYYLNRFIKYKPEQVYIIDKDESTGKFPSVVEIVRYGAKFLHFELKRDNLQDLFDAKLKLKKDDIIIDLTTQTCTYYIFQECRMRNILYINTSIEDDDIIKDSIITCPVNNGIFLQHINLQVIADKTRDYGNTTALIEFGMNPGLISVFIKQGIMNLAKQVIKYRKTKGKKVNKKMEGYVKEKNHKKLAQMMGIEVMHCSEIDTQLPKIIDKGKFINTWSCVGLITEGLEPAEIQIGTHEKFVPFAKSEVNQVIPQLLITKAYGKDLKFESIAPLKINSDDSVTFTKFEGRCIHHGEGISLNRYLGSFKYAPTMHYVYKLNPYTEKLIDETSPQEMVNILNDPSKWKVLNMHDDKIEGYDNIGALFISRKNPFTESDELFYFWTGSILNTDYTKNTLKDQYFGPTVIQVMAGVLSGVVWMMKHKNKGLCFGEDIDDKFVINMSKKYLGRYYSRPVIVSKEHELNGTTMDKLFVDKNAEKTHVDDL
jgi:homospermidine synthase